jgi:hypothetical protein
LAHGGEILTEIGELSCMGIRKEVTGKGDIVSYFSDF